MAITEISEQQALTQVAERLRTRFPQASGEDVVAVVRSVREQYAGATVRDFIPILVERQAADVLSVPRQRTPHSAA